MRKADFQARIKKIEIANKVLSDSWFQTIRVILGDIDLTNENLLELRQFQPNEPVNVIIKPAEPTIFDIQAPPVQAQTKQKAAQNQELADKEQGEEDDRFLTFTEEDENTGEPPGKVVREFKI